MCFWPCCDPRSINAKSFADDVAFEWERGVYDQYYYDYSGDNLWAGVNNLVDRDSFGGFPGGLPHTYRYQLHRLDRTGTVIDAAMDYTYRSTGAPTQQSPPVARLIEGVVIDNGQRIVVVLDRFYHAPPPAFGAPFAMDMRRKANTPQDAVVLRFDLLGARTQIPGPIGPVGPGGGGGVDAEYEIQYAVGNRTESIIVPVDATAAAIATLIQNAMIAEGVPAATLASVTGGPAHVAEVEITYDETTPFRIIKWQGANLARDFVGVWDFALNKLIWHGTPEGTFTDHLGRVTRIWFGTHNADGNDTGSNSLVDGPRNPAGMIPTSDGRVAWRMRRGGLSFNRFEPVLSVWTPQTTALTIGSLIESDDRAYYEFTAAWTASIRRGVSDPDPSAVWPVDGGFVAEHSLAVRKLGSPVAFNWRLFTLSVTPTTVRPFVGHVTRSLSTARTHVTADCVDYVCLSTQFANTAAPTGAPAGGRVRTWDLTGAEVGAFHTVFTDLIDVDSDNQRLMLRRDHTSDINVICTGAPNNWSNQTLRPGERPGAENAPVWSLCFVPTWGIDISLSTNWRLEFVSNDLKRNADGSLRPSGPYYTPYYPIDADLSIVLADVLSLGFCGYGTGIDAMTGDLIVQDARLPNCLGVFWNQPALSGLDRFAAGISIDFKGYHEANTNPFDRPFLFSQFNHQRYQYCSPNVIGLGRDFRMTSDSSLLGNIDPANRWHWSAFNGTGYAHRYWENLAGLPALAREQLTGTPLGWKGPTRFRHDGSVLSVQATRAFRANNTGAPSYL